MATDVTGYRADGGSLGQQQNVSDQLRKILTNKLPLLNSPGTVIENSLYYDVTSSSVSAVEAQETFCKDRINMSSFTFGSSPTAYIPSVLFAGSTFLVATLPNLKYPSNTKFSDIAKSPANNLFYAPQGWLFNCIQSVIVYMGACSIAQIEIDGWSNFMIAMACCETEGKRKQMIVQAGEMLYNNHDNSKSHTKMAGFNDSTLAPVYADNSTYNPGGSIFVMNSEYAGDDYFYLDNEINWCYYPMATAICPIRLPFSGMAALERKLSFDTKLTTQPIQITIQLKNFNECFKCGSNIAPANPSFSSLSLQLWQEELSDKSLSVRNELLAMPQFNVGYPFQYTQSIPFPLNSDNSGGKGQTAFGQNQYNQTQITMNITSIINSDLTTMLFMLTWDYRSTTAPLVQTHSQSDGGNIAVDANQFCPLLGEKLTNMQLYLNGQRFYSFEQDIYAGATLAKQLDKINSGILCPINPRLKDMNSVNPNTLFKAVDSNIYELNMSRLRSLVCESHMQNTARFTNQTFQLVFNIERGYFYPFVRDPTYKSRCTLHMAYEYNAVILVGGDGGTTKLVTN